MAIMPAPRGTDQDTLTRLINQWGAKRSRNVLRSVYYDGKNALRDLGISLPPKLRNMEVVLGWPAKAVHGLVARCNFDGFVLPGEADDPFDLVAMLSDAGADALLPQAFTSAATHSVSFLTITPGDESAGEPPVLLLPKSAADATGIWDARTQSLSDGLSVTRFDENGTPDQFVWYSREHVTTFEKSPGGKWLVDSQPNRLRRTWMEPLVFRPELHRPFGHSRISRPVMALTDAGLRVLARSESHAEFFASPQRYALGAEKEAFGSNQERWNAVMSRFLTITRDENGDIPELGQFPQMSMQPHFEHLRTLAMLFAGETSLPLSALGIVQDNPSSAEAIYAGLEGLIIEANGFIRSLGASLRRAGITMVMLRDGLTEVPAELRGLRARFQNTATPSVVSASDAMAKQIAALPWLAESDVALETLGYTEDQIIRLQADRRRRSGSSVLDRLRSATSNQVAAEA